MRYYVIETQHRTDGDINFIKTEKYTWASALSYALTRRAAYAVDTTYPSAAVKILDENLEEQPIPTDNPIQTAYVAPETTE